MLFFFLLKYKFRSVLNKILKLYLKGKWVPSFVYTPTLNNQETSTLSISLSVCISLFLFLLLGSVCLFLLYLFCFISLPHPHRTTHTHKQSFRHPIIHKSWHIIIARLHMCYEAIIGFWKRFWKFSSKTKLHLFIKFWLWSNTFGQKKTITGNV
jgi:hypothetical protein